MIKLFRDPKTKRVATNYDGCVVYLTTEEGTLVTGVPTIENIQKMVWLAIRIFGHAADSFVNVDTEEFETYISPDIEREMRTLLLQKFGHCNRISTPVTTLTTAVYKFMVQVRIDFGGCVGSTIKYSPFASEQDAVDYVDLDHFSRKDAPFPIRWRVINMETLTVIEERSIGYDKITVPLSFSNGSNKEI